jgi:muramoyltetrapeptide carboxypeptidase
MLIKPPGLKPGDRIGVVAPAGVVAPQELESGVARLAALGFEVQVGAAVQGPRARYLAAPDAARAADLSAFLADRTIKAVIAARGGYGSARLIPHLDLERAQPKVVVGSSDLTVLLAFLQSRLGWVVFHGPMVAPNFGRSPAALTDDSFRRVLFAPGQAGTIAPPGVRPLRRGRARGRLAGGCLSLLVSTLGTPYEIDTRGALLLIEDINEAPYRLDRMLTQLRHAGKLEQARGVVFGRMVGCHPEPQAGYALDAVLVELLGEFAGPVVVDFPAGHGGEQVTLPLGVEATLDADRGALILEEPGVG